MKPHPTPHRIRKTIKWGKYGGAGVTVLLVMVWIGSGWWTFVWTFSSGRFFNVIHGSIRVGSAGGSLRNPTIELREETVAPSFFPWWIHGGGGGQSWTVYIPMWIPVAFAALTTAAVWRLDILARRRAWVGLCPKCNYDRAGLAKDAVCPECGSKGGPA